MAEQPRKEKRDRMEEQAKQPGTLYLCATPIGNLEDMTYRAVRILGAVPLIAAEDTRHTRQLLTHFDIHTKLTSYHEHNKASKGPELVDWLLAGNDLACVSDAGLPGISDPGTHLAQLAIEAGIRVTPLPGANAALSALICSGLDTRYFTFIGFLSRQKKERAEQLGRAQRHTETLIFYEAPHHLKATLQDLAEALGGSRHASACRELTKRFEEFRRGTLQELADYYAENEPRGEFVLIVEGAAAEAESGTEEQPKDLASLYASCLAQGLPKKEAMRETAKALGLSRRDVYQALLSIEGEQEAQEE